MADEKKIGQNEKFEIPNKAEVTAMVEKEQETGKRNMVANLDDGIYSSSDTFVLASQMAKGLAQSTLVPLQFQKSVSNCLIALELANRFHTSPLMIMQNTYIIQGRPSFSSSFLIAMVNGSGKYDQELAFDVKNDKEGNPYSCVCWTMKDGRRIEGMEVNMTMAEKEGWLSKNGSKWKTLQGLMLRYRAAAFFVRLNCPELSLGFYTQEEYEDNDFSNSKSKVKKPASLNDVIEEENIIDGEVISEE